MSGINKQVVLVPPSHMQNGRNRELFVSPGYTCSYCHGNGWYWGMDDFRDSMKVTCPVCGGSGQLDAVVTVEWKPSMKEG